MAEHIGPDQFSVLDLTVQTTGTPTSFHRGTEHRPALDAFCDWTGHDYKRFNYIGEWHSHPHFSTEPTSVDDESMTAIVTDPETGAHFVVLLIVRLNAGQLEGSVHAYLPDGSKHRARLTMTPSAVPGGDAIDWQARAEQAEAERDALIERVAALEADPRILDWWKVEPGRYAVVGRVVHVESEDMGIVNLATGEVFLPARAMEPVHG